MSKIVVMMSSYNGEKYIRKQIESILAQDTTHLVDIIVRDDGSIDSTQLILRDYQRRGILRWYTGKNLKPAHSFMDILRTCGQYDYYCFCDQDDYWLSDKLSSGVDMLEKIEGMAIYFCNARLVNDELAFLGRNVYRNIPCVNLHTVMCAPNVLGCTMILNKQLVEMFRNHEVPRTVAMHDSFIVKTCVAVGGHVLYDHRVHMWYRQHENNVLGVPIGVWRKIKNRISGVINKSPITIDEQAEEIIKLYSDIIPIENLHYLQKVAEYRTNLKSRLCLALSRKTHYISINMGLQIRLGILLGKR